MRCPRRADPLAGGRPGAGRGAGEGGCPGKAVRVAAGESIQRAAIRAGEGGTICIGSGLYRMQEIAPLRVRRLASPAASSTVRASSGSSEGRARTGPSLDCTRAMWALAGVAAALALPPVAGRVPRRTAAHPRRVAQRSRSRTLRGGGGGRPRDPRRQPGGTPRRGQRGALRLPQPGADVRSRGFVVEKYDTPTQNGGGSAAATAPGGAWRIADPPECRLGVDVGSDGAITGSTIERNGQLGAAAQGQRILIENIRIAWNNTAGFDPNGRPAPQDHPEPGVVLRGNRVPRQCGSGLLVRHRLPRRPVREEYGGEQFHRRDLLRDLLRRRDPREYAALQRRGPSGLVLGADIQVAASSGVEVFDNTITVRPTAAPSCSSTRAARRTAAVLQDDRNRVHDNRILFTGRGSAGGVTDTNEAAPNARIIEEAATVSTGTPTPRPPT